MILNVNQKESAALTLHMLVMRKSYRNLFKGRYKARREELYQTYDYVLNLSKKALESELETFDMHLNIRDLEMLCEVLRSYADKFRKEVGNLLKGEDLEQINILDQLHARCRELLAA